MFKNSNQNIRMLKGAYKKLKSYYYYDKKFLLIRRKIAEFECNHDKMEQCFIDMAKLLEHPRSFSSKLYFDSLLEQIDFYVVPQKYDTPMNQSNRQVTNTVIHDKRMKTVNFFIDAPIEVLILDSLWTVFLAKLDYDTGVLSNDIYGNTINESRLFDYSGEIDFDSIGLFNRYYQKYTAWRNRAFRSLEENFDSANDSVLISLDIQSYYYSVRFRFAYLKDCFGNHLLLKQIHALTLLMRQVYYSYTSIIKSYRKDLSDLKKGEYPLPIGLFSSMFLGNLYLKEFDMQVRDIKGIDYYGRYVDDILLVVRKSMTSGEKDSKIIGDVLINSGLLIENNDMYQFTRYKNLYIQSSKIKIIYIDHNESRAIIDTYNKTIKEYPSQMDKPFWGMDLSKINEEIYSIEYINIENKIRDIEAVEVTSLKVGRFFSALPRRYSNINVFGGDTGAEINNHLYQIKKFFNGSQTVEYHAQWLNYMYFLVIVKRKEQLIEFVDEATKCIRQLLSYRSLEESLYREAGMLSEKAKEFLLQHLSVSLEVALSIDLDFAKKHFESHFLMTEKYVSSNMFEHSFVAFPLANYIDFTDDISFSKMELYEIGECPDDFSSSFKFIWSPRFIHFHELLFLHFYRRYINHGKGVDNNCELDAIIKEYCNINNLRSVPFQLKNTTVISNEDYLLEAIDFPKGTDSLPKEIDVVVGSIDVHIPDNTKDFDRWSHITFEEKELLFDVLNQVYCYYEKSKENDRNPTILVLPELCCPIYWINDLIRFSKNNQIAIVTGLQYIGDKTNYKYNYLATILPFESGMYKYRNAYISIREKNDYSPYEYEGLANMGFACMDSAIANYQVFYWRGIHLTPMVCFELTDVMARAILKGHSDVIAAAVCNRDTTYFSNIIDSTARDLHAFVIQANSSVFGDSRVTGPYDRDSKDIFKIKGGKNDHAVIGSVQLGKLKYYHEHYYSDREEKLREIKEERHKEKSNYDTPKREKPYIKPLPARYKSR